MLERLNINSAFISTVCGAFSLTRVDSVESPVM